MIKLISLDLDGTLLDPRGKITAASKAAIAKARAAGVRVVINTGRPAPEALAFVREADTDLLASVLGGAAVVDFASGRTLRRWDIEAPWDRKTLETCLGRGLGLMIFAGEEILVEPGYKKILEEIYPYPAFHSAAVVTSDPLGYIAEHRLPLTKIHAAGDPKSFPLEELSALEGIGLTSSNAQDFEVLGRQVDKGRSLAELAALYGVALEECAAVGDSENDLGAFRAVGTPIAMGNAPQNVKAAAARVAPSNREEGAAWAVLSCLE